MIKVRDGAEYRKAVSLIITLYYAVVQGLAGIYIRSAGQRYASVVIGCRVQLRGVPLARWREGALASPALLRSTGL